MDSTFLAYKRYSVLCLAPSRITLGVKLLPLELHHVQVIRSPSTGASMKHTIIIAIEYISVDSRYLHLLIIWPGASH